MSIHANNTHMHNAAGTRIGDLSEFVAIPEKRSVPNHLLDTQIYSNECDNEIFQCRPRAIHFQGFHAGGKYSQKIRIMNVSPECQRMHVIPPSSNVFKIHYSKGDSLVPGMYLEVKIVFTPQENVYQHDCIRIHSRSAVNLTIPIYAYLKMDVSSFPNHIQFKSTQVGHSAVKKIPLKNIAPVDFSFQITFLQQNHSVFNIYPLSGIVPANGCIDVFIKYAPTQYCTSSVGIQIIVSQFNFQPHHCTITGVSEPGIASKLKLKQIETSREVIKPKNISFSGSTQMKNKSDKVKLKIVEEDAVKKSLEFPLNLKGHSSVAGILSQKAGKLRAKDVKAVVNKGKTETSCSSKQVKEAIFEHVMLKNITEEQRNQLRWGVKIGESLISELYRSDILKQRGKAMENYQTMQGNSDRKCEFLRTTAQPSHDRIWRCVDEKPVCRPTFDLFLNDDWQRHHLVLEKFVQAARKVIWMTRATKSLKTMGSYLSDWRHGSFKYIRPLNEDNIEQNLVEKVSLKIIGTKLLPFSLPTNKNSKLKDDTAVDALNILPVKETYINLDRKVCLYDLKVPLQYNLLHYNVHPFSSATTSYLKNGLSRNLRTGPDIEVPPECVVEEAEICIDRELIEDDSCYDNGNQLVTAPLYLLEQKMYHPLHIFNPLPGVSAHVVPLPYSEIDDDYSLSPLSVAMPRLDRDGVIPGAMNWKKFPSHGLVAMSSPSLYNVYVPRWSDSFGEDLTVSAPPLLTSLPDDDLSELIEPDDISDVVVPNMDMISAEFTVTNNIEDKSDNTEFADSMILPSTNNPVSKYGVVPRDEMKTELNRYLHKQMNNLGNRIKSRTSQFEHMWAKGEFS